MTSPQPPLALLPDMPDTRLLVELTSHASDLSEASHTLASALAAGESSELWLPLTSHAVTAYIRPFIHSNVRTRLDEMPEVPAVPPSMKWLHQAIRQYRNTTIAHSQSNLALPLPIVLLDDAGQATKVAPISLINQMPLAIAERFAALILAMEDAVDQATQPVLDRLHVWLRDKTAGEVMNWDPPEVVHATALEFNAGERRTPFPRFSAFWQKHLPCEERFVGEPA
ncbi:hypothetical protein AB0280_17160 [Pseudarthrobacter sp902506025]|uniref:hypothetical protein n=1 Tax=Pseudarthrobacter sp. 902506025 TaxID=3155291 RepID=UPI00344E82CD